MGRSRPALLALLALHVLFVQASGQKSQTLSQQLLDDYRRLAGGVGKVQSGELSASRLILFGSGTLALALDGSVSVSVAAARFGAGRAVNFGHEGYLTYSAAATSGAGKLLHNSLLWASGKATSVRVAGLSQWGADIATALAQSNSAFKSVGVVAPSALALSKPDVVIANGQDQDVATSAALIRAYVKGGGGLVIGAQAWYWAYEQPLEQHPANVLLLPMGIYTSEGVVQADFTMPPTAPPSQLGNADLALNCTDATYKGSTGSPFYLEGEDDRKGAVDTMMAAMRTLPTNSTYWGRLQKLAATAPTASTGINPNQPVARASVDGLAAALRSIRYSRLPPEQLPEAPDAKWFPGVPPAGTKPLGSTRVTINGTTLTTHWQTLGLWAMAGKPVNVTLPQALLTAAAGTGAAIQLHIGGWTDSLWNKESWPRLPDMVRAYLVSKPTTTIGSAVGGLIYISLPERLTLGAQAITVSGAIKAPIYVHGVTKLADWKAILSSSPAPWGELSSSKFIIMTPKASLAKVANPSAVMSYWDKVLDSHAWLAGLPLSRPHAERMQHDVDISNGYMHSGYPIMTYMDVVDTTMDPSAGHWGHFHELGHNFQGYWNGYWNWDCTGEVSCNFFAARAYAVVKNVTTPENFYGWWGDDMTSRPAMTKEYMAAGPNYNNLCPNPGLMLDSFLQITEIGKFGFELIRKTISSYSNLRAEDIPGTDAERANLWVRQQSKAAGVSFIKYYKGWGWPISAATEAALARLPPWKGPSSPPLPPRPPPPRPPAKSPPPARPSPPLNYPARCADYSSIMVGVGNVSTNAVASILVVWGNAIPLLARAPGSFYAAASRYGQGRVVAVGHEVLMGFTSGGLGLFNKNAALWAAGMGKVGGTAKLCRNADDTWTEAAANAYKQQVSSLSAPEAVSPLALGGSSCKVYVMTAYAALNAAAVAAVQDFVRLGGGLLLGGHFWGSEGQFTDPGSTWHGNKVLLPMGLSFHSDYDFLAPHSVPTACPAAATSLADAAANALAAGGASGLASDQRALAAGIVARAKAYVPNTAATSSLWAALNKVPNK